MSPSAWYFTIVYASPHQIQREEVWRELIGLRDKVDGLQLLWMPTTLSLIVSILSTFWIWGLLVSLTLGVMGGLANGWTRLFATQHGRTCSLTAQLLIFLWFPPIIVGFGCAFPVTENQVVIEFISSFLVPGWTTRTSITKLETLRFLLLLHLITCIV